MLFLTVVHGKPLHSLPLPVLFSESLQTLWPDNVKFDS